MLNSAAPLPSRVADETGALWTITRAWPGRDSTVTFEASSPRSPHVRGGSSSAETGIALAPLAHDSRLPALERLAAEGDVVVHRPGRRAVVRHSDGTRFTKVVRPGRAGAVLDSARQGELFAVAFRVPAILDSSADSVQFEAISGRTLLAFGADPSVDAASWARAWAAWSTAWTTTIGNPPRASATLPTGTAPVHTAGHEAEVVRTWAAHAVRLVPSTTEAGLLGDCADRVAELLLRSAADPLVTSHRDLHDKQLLWHPADGLGLLDFDTATRAEAALDLGNLAAHLRLRRRQGLWDAARTNAALAVVRQAAETLGVDGRRLRAYETAARFRISCVYAYRPRWTDLARQLQQELVRELVPGSPGAASPVHR